MTARRSASESTEAVPRATVSLSCTLTTEDGGHETNYLIGTCPSRHDDQSYTSSSSSRHRSVLAQLARSWLLGSPETLLPFWQLRTFTGQAHRVDTMTTRKVRTWKSWSPWCACLSFLRFSRSPFAFSVTLHSSITFLDALGKDTRARAGMAL